MGKIALLFIFVFCSFAAFAQEIVVVLSPFKFSGGITKDDVQFAQKLLVTELADINNLILIDHTTTERTKEEMRFQNSEFSSGNKAVDFERALNANYSVNIDLTKRGGKIYLLGTIDNLNTTRLQYSLRMQLESVDELFDRLPEISKTLAAKMPPPPLINHFIGRWQANASYRCGDKNVSGVCILNIQADGRVIVERYDNARCEKGSFYDNLVKPAGSATGTGMVGDVAKSGDGFTIPVSLNFTHNLADGIRTSFQETARIAGRNANAFELRVMYMYLTSGSDAYYTTFTRLAPKEEAAR